MTERLDGRAGIITGAGRGIGAAIAGELARLGARLVLADLSEDGCREVASRIAAASGAALPVAADVRRFADT